MRSWESLSPLERSRAAMEIRANPVFGYLYARREREALEQMINGTTAELREQARQRLLSLRTLGKEVDDLIAAEPAARMGG